MGENIYRGGWIKNGEWIEGYYVFLNNTHYIIEAGSEDWRDNGEWFQVVPKSIGQYTGLKDENGEKIFKGDIILYRANNINDVGVVDFADGAFGVRFSNGTSAMFLCFAANHSVVIGNIYRDKELVKVYNLSTVCS